MIPVTDAVRPRRFPYVNLAIIIACCLVFLYELTLGTESEVNEFFLEWGVIPDELTDWLSSPSGLAEPATIITSAFVHGGWLHLISNMIYLWVFGDNVEDVLGHFGYVVFYILGATAAVAAQVAVDPSSTVPIVGASGAIAAVLGAYLVLYPRAPVGVLFFIIILPVPALVLIVFWFIMQLFAGIASLGTSEATSGVAVWAHVGGFITGVLITLALRPLIGARISRRPRWRSSDWG
jgi:membrane associated rhomboid family serine protease